MTLLNRVVTATIWLLLRLLCRIHDAELDRVPARGPLILATNHVNFLEPPLVYTHLQPRPLAGFAKAETWRSPPLRFLADLWGAIPLRRGEADTAAVRRALRALEEGRILGVAPEGTRSGHGRLQRGNPGVVLLALRSGAPILPMVCWGHEHFWTKLKGLRRTDLHMRVGRPFSLKTDEVKVDRQLRQRITDEIMYQLAALLPPESRGVYADLSEATEEHLQFAPGVQSNLHGLR